MKRHRRTDPGCLQHRQPTTRLQRWLYDRARGRSCRVCFPPAPGATERVLIKLATLRDDALAQPAYCPRDNPFCETRALHQHGPDCSINCPCQPGRVPR